jgi:tRNA-Thr(GGU) m(6)t(6)A37 methyltransferase TsaA
MEFLMRPIGEIHSPFIDKHEVPIQASHSDILGSVEVYPAYVDGLLDLNGFSHVILIYAFHRSDHYDLQVVPFLDDRYHGLFATRYPARPNPIGLSVVELLAVHDNVLEIRGVDMLNDTPLLDIKPYVPEFDMRANVRVGWYGTRHGGSAHL